MTTVANGDAVATTELFCDTNGKTVARKTTAGESVSSRFDIAGIGELRPQEGIFLMRVPVGDMVQVEEAWSLETGERVVEKSGYIFSDLRGSVLAKTSFTGDTVVEEAEYDAWGASARVSDLSKPQHGFTGEEPDPVMGIYHFGVRAYDPTLRRWLSPDPLFTTQPGSDIAPAAQLNLYSYAVNNPVVVTDPSGLAGMGGFLDDHVTKAPRAPMVTMEDLKDLDSLQMTLDGLSLSTTGWMEPVSISADVVNAGVSYARGNTGEALMSLGGAVPFIGGPIIAKKIAKNLDRIAEAADAADTAADAAKAADKATDASKVAEAPTKTDRLKKHVLNGEMDAARREAGGEVVARKADGTPWDHVTELRDAQRGLVNRINKIKKQLGGKDLTDDARGALQKELSEASKLLDKTEEYLPR